MVCLIELKFGMHIINNYHMTSISFGEYRAYSFFAGMQNNNNIYIYVIAYGLKLLKVFCQLNDAFD